MHPGTVLERRRTATQVLERSKWRGYLPRQSAFKKFVEKDIPGLADMVAICQRVLAVYESASVESSNSKKPFFSAIITLT